MAGSDSGQGGSPWTSATTVLASVFVLLLVIAGVVVLIVKPGNSGHHAPSRRSAVARTGSDKPSSPPPGQVIVTPTGTRTTGTPTQPAKGGCSLPAGSQQLPASAPPTGTSWQTVGAMSVPQAPHTLGPQHTDGIWHTCFAHSPSGALLAALNLYAEETTSVPVGEVYRRLSINAPTKAFDATTNLESGAGAGVQVAGYRYDGYSPSRAVVIVALQFTNGNISTVVTPMQWVRSIADWRYVFPPNGVPDFTVLQTSTLSPPYVSWSQFQ